MKHDKNSIFIGQVTHRRFFPRKHFFKYKMGAYLIPLVGNEEEINKNLQRDGLKGEFRRSDYFGDPKESLAQSVLKASSSILSQEVSGEVLFLGQLREFGFYFSPVNFYLIQQNGKTKYLFAEVTNTPWKEKHCYVINVEKPMPHKKEFHVSPFHPMEMRYHWVVDISEKQIFIKIDCHTDKKEFDAGILLKRNNLASRPGLFMCFKIVAGIYFEAIRLFFKKTPFYGHPSLRHQSKVDSLTL